MDLARKLKMAQAAALMAELASRVTPVVLDVLDAHDEKTAEETAEIVAARVGESGSRGMLGQVSRGTVTLFSAAVVSLVKDLTQGGSR